MKPWSINSRSIFIYVLSALFLAISMVFVIIFFLKQELTTLEDIDVKRNTQRVENTYDFVRNLYEKKIADWGDWDDTYTFIKDFNKDYIESNLGESTLKNLNVDEILYFDELGKLNYSVASSETLKIEPEFPEDVEDIFINHLTVNSVLSGELKSGLLKTEDGVLLFAAHPIAKSDGSGPNRGIILFGRYLSDWLVQDMSDIAQVKVSFSQNSNNVITKDVLINTVEIPILNDSSKIYLNVETKREIWVNVQKSFYLLITVTILITILSMAVNYFFLQNYVLNDLQKFRQEIGEIISSGGFGTIEKTGKSSDMDQLREDINTLLQKLASLKDVEDIKIKELNDLNNLMVGRELRMTELKRSLEDIKKKIT